MKTLKINGKYLLLNGAYAIIVLVVVVILRYWAHSDNPEIFEDILMFGVPLALLYYTLFMRMCIIIDEDKLIYKSEKSVLKESIDLHQVRKIQIKDRKHIPVIKIYWEDKHSVKLYPADVSAFISEIKRVCPDVQIETDRS